MHKILLLVPLVGNGGIASWAKKFMEMFPDDEFSFVPFSVNKRDKNEIYTSTIKRILSGIEDVFYLIKKLKSVINDNEIEIIHTTTSGSFGIIRDLIIGFMCKNKIETVLHCHYGNLPEKLNKRIWRYLTVKSMGFFSQIWVLDNKSLSSLKSFSVLSGKVFLTPNSFDVKPNLDIKKKNYDNVAFVGNIIPTKGIYEVLEAVSKSSTIKMLHIIGPVPETEKSTFQERLSLLPPQKVKYYGRIPNEEVLEILKGVDIICLPTYYPFEAFPISILEAMALGKFVISTKRAAIPDMLTDINGNSCGYFVREKSSEDIIQGFIWCYNHKSQADLMCQKAYEKVYNFYRTEVVFETYRQLYGKLVTIKECDN